MKKMPKGYWDGMAQKFIALAELDKNNPDRFERFSDLAEEAARNLGFIGSRDEAIRFWIELCADGYSKETIQ